MLEQVANPGHQTAIFALSCPSQQCKDSGAFPYLEEGFASGHFECPNCHTQYRAAITHQQPWRESGFTSRIELTEEK